LVLGVSGDQLSSSVAANVASGASDKNSGSHLDGMLFGLLDFLVAVLWSSRIGVSMLVELLF
jgi:hypothetical protein